MTEWWLRLIMCLLSMLVLTLLAACGGSSGGTAAPSLIGVSPGEAFSACGDTVTLSGSGFAGGVDAVTIGGAPATDVVVQDDSTLTCTVPPGPPGPQTVVVRTSRGEARLEGAFTYQGPIQGDYAQVTFEGLTSGLGTPGHTARVLWGLAEADGLTGTVTTEGVAHTSTTGFLERGTFVETYTPREEARVELGPYVGGLSDVTQPSDVVALASSSGNPAISFLLSRRGEPSDASLLSGDYAFVMFGYAGVESAGWGTLSFDGAGTVSNIMITSNVRGSLVPPSSEPPTPYAVDTNGGVGFELGGASLSGSILGDGDLVVLAGSSDTAIDIQTIAILVPQAAAATRATLRGTYHLVGFESQRDSAPVTLPAPHFQSAVGTATADGSGTLVVARDLITNVDGATSTSLSADLPVSYLVATDGTLAAGSFHGAVSPDGRFAILAGDAVNSPPVGPPGILFLLRKP